MRSGTSTCYYIALLMFYISRFLAFIKDLCDQTLVMYGRLNWMRSGFIPTERKVSAEDEPHSSFVIGYLLDEPLDKYLSLYQTIPIL
jgi:hypothetical protein